MAIVGNSDIIILPDGVDPNNTSGYDELHGSQNQLLAVNENSANLWIFNTTTNLWVKVNSATENVGGEQEVYDDEGDSSYRDIRTFTTRDSSMRVLQRTNTLDLRAIGHSLNDFKKFPHSIFKNELYSYTDGLPFSLNTPIKITSVNLGNGTFEIDLPLNKQIDFNPLKDGKKWYVYRRNSSASLYYEIVKYSNNGIVGTFYYDKIGGSPNPTTNLEIELCNPWLNCYNINSDESVAFPSLKSGETYDGITIQSSYVIGYYYINQIHYVLVNVVGVNGNSYLIKVSSNDFNTWVVDPIPIYTNTYLNFTAGSSVRIENERTNLLGKIIVFHAGSAVPKCIILNEDFTIFSNPSVLTLDSLPHTVFSSVNTYKGKIYFYFMNSNYLGITNNSYYQIINSGDSLDTTDKYFEVNSLYNYISVSGQILTKENNHNFIRLLRIVGEYTVLKNSGGYIAATERLADFKLNTQKVFFTTPFNAIDSTLLWQKKPLGHDLIFEYNNKKYFFTTRSNISTDANIGLFVLRDYSQTTLEEVITDTFEITESTYTQQNQTTLIINTATTINLKLSKYWQGKDLIIKNSGGFTCNIIPAGSETIDGTTGYNFSGGSIALRALGGKIITYNK